MRVFKFLLILLLVLSAVAATAQDSETIVIRGFGNISTFNPIVSSDGASFQAYSLLWPKPYEIDPMTYAPVPGLTTWEAADDGLSFTFHILEDANWSDGEPITSHDMKFVVDAIKSPEVASWRAADFENVEGVEIIDDKTYKVVLTKPDCTVFAELGGTRFLPAHRFAADFSDFRDGEISTNPLEISGGPYIMDAWEPDAFQSFYANPNWWGGDVGIPYLINRLIKEHAVAAQSLQAGEVDYTYLHGDFFGQIADTSNLQWEIFPQMSVKFMSLNWADPTQPTPAFDADGNRNEQPPHPIFTDVNVRKAIAMGYNKHDILATMGGEQGGTRLVGAVNPAHGLAYNHDLEPYPYDPEAAMALLEEAGWVDEDGDGVREKDGQRLEFTISYTDILSMFPTTTLIAQDQLKDIGVDAKVELVEWANYLSEVFFGQKHDATSMSSSGGTGGAPDPNDFMGIIYSPQDIATGAGGGNTSSYVNPEVDALIDKARTLPGCDPVERGEIYKEIQRITHEQVAYDWTFVPNIWQTATKRVQGFEPTAFWVFYGYTADIHKWTLEE
ncbi:MAG: ABC transporter substrate-binding protein [Chloroflexi bacterium]|nr:ABC transporter substrate-binding protein [Chloroflexota bacterium]